MNRQNLTDHLVNQGVPPTQAQKLSLSLAKDVKSFADENLQGEVARLSTALQNLQEQKDASAAAQIKALQDENNTLRFSVQQLHNQIFELENQRTEFARAEREQHAIAAQQNRTPNNVTIEPDEPAGTQ